MGSEKRTRQRENRQAKQEAQRRREKSAKLRRRLIIGAAALIVLVAIFWLGNRASGAPTAPADWSGAAPPPAIGAYSLSPDAAPPGTALATDF